MTTVFAHYDGRVIVPEQPLDLSVDDRLKITITVRPRPADGPRPGSPAAVLQPMAMMPPLTAEDAAALEQSLTEAKTPGRYDGLFDDVTEP